MISLYLAVLGGNQKKVLLVDHPQQALLCGSIRQPDNMPYNTVRSVVLWRIDTLKKYIAVLSTESLRLLRVSFLVIH